MKMHHHVPVAQTSSDPVSAEYMAEVEKHTARGEAAYAKAQKRLEAAERRLARAHRRRERAKTKRDQRDATKSAAYLAEVVELRRQELTDLHRTLRGSPQSSTHRGDRSHRHVNTSEPL